jgi:hypothetical protein
MTLVKFVVYLLKVIMFISYDSANPPLAINPTEISTYVHQKTYTRIFITVLFTIAQK